MIELPKVKTTPMPPCKPLRTLESELRDQIAIEAMKLLIGPILDIEPGSWNPQERIAVVSYRIADAMLVTRNNPISPTEPDGLLEAVKALLAVEGGISIVHQKSADAYERMRRIAERAR